MEIYQGYREIPGGGRSLVGVIALDSNIFIRALDDPGPLGKKSRAFLENIREKTPKVFISVMILEEFFVKVYKLKREKDLDSILDFITIGGLAKLVDVNKQIALLAAKIRADYHVKAPDALHLACAIEVGAERFITTDKRLPRKIGKLKVEVLS